MFDAPLYAVSPGRAFIDWVCSCRAAWLPVQRVHQALRNQLLAATLQMPDSAWHVHSAPRFHFDVAYTLPARRLGWTPGIETAQDQQSGHHGQYAVRGVPGMRAFRFCRAMTNRSGTVPFV